MTIVETDTGLILIDPLISIETAKAGLDLYYEAVEQPQSGKRPVKALVYTHSHEDHFGGAKGVVNEDDVKSGKVQVIAPDGFLKEAVSENVYAGNAMFRRALYMYGSALPRDAKNSVGAGLGQATSFGQTSLIPPTDTIKKTGEKRNIDGVDIEFLMAPGTEAPAEMLLYFPKTKTLNVAEDAVHTMHNLYTLRGAQVRDASKWWKVLDQVVDIYGDNTEIILGQHHWPKWGNENIVKYLKNQRDGYKYMHDQTLNLINKGYTPIEIAEQLKLPEELDKQWYMRGYYGTLNHNVKAIYQRYMGWYDGNPANLYPLPPQEVGKKYVEAFGGAEAAITKAQKAYNKGEYRWVAEMMKHVVFANPNNQKAKNLQADALEQLAYQSESGPWRSVFLMAAYELRNGIIKQPGALVSVDILTNMTNEMLFDFMGISLNGPKAAGQDLSFNWIVDNGDKYSFWIENGVLMYKKDKLLDKPNATIKGSKLDFISVMMKAIPLQNAIDKKQVAIEGSTESVNKLIGLFDTFSPNFNVVTP